MKNNASLVYNFALVVGDYLALLAAFGFAYVLRVTWDPRPLIEQIPASTYFGIFVTLLPFWLIIFGLLGLYNERVYNNRFSEFGRLLTGSFLGILFLIGYDFVSKRGIFPARLVPVYGVIIGFLFTLLFRTLARSLRRALFRYGVGINSVLLVGNTPITGELILSLRDTPNTGYRVIGIVGEHHGSKNDFGDIPVFANFDEATAKLGAARIYSIIQTELFAEPSVNEEILNYAQENHIAYRFIPGNSELFVGNLEVGLFQSVPVIAVHQTPLLGWGRIVKRLFDVVIGSALLIITSPFLLLSALLIKLFGGRGGIFFRQTRLTRFNQKFRVYKFRTAKSEFNGLTHEEVFQKLGRPELLQEFYDNGEYLPNDPRYSRLGRFLRQTSLDELPQLFNVIKGDLSLVGPRALIPEELTKYTKRHAILSVKSGITGLAQVSGRRNISFDERRQLDIFYVQNWNFWTDIVILTKTIWVVLTGSGAK